MIMILYDYLTFLTYCISGSEILLEVWVRLHLIILIDIK